MSHTFKLTKVGSGKSQFWQCRVKGYVFGGSGGRPDLAIRAWKEQKRRWQKFEEAKK